MLSWVFAYVATMTGGGPACVDDHGILYLKHARFRSPASLCPRWDPGHDDLIYPIEQRLRQPLEVK
jgi:hypothetical protein